MAKRTCKVAGCLTPSRKLGMCDKHYWRLKRTGTTDDPTSPLERFVVAPSGCWIWTGARSPKGYGILKINQREIRAHRHFYEAHVGPIPDGLEIDHLCRTRECVNPAHLEPVTKRENLARSSNLAAIAINFNTCIHGHPLTEDNVYRAPSRPRQRRCRICIKNRSRTREVGDPPALGA